MPDATLIACCECDLLQRRVALAPGDVASCDRCGGALYPHHPHRLDHALALALAGLVIFVVANSLPMVGLDVKGQLTQTTLFGAVRALYEDGMPLVAALVLGTTVLAPLAELVAIVALLLPLRLGRRPRHAGALVRALRAVQPWSMAEVFMLGVLVALVKLSHIATVVPGVAAWGFAALVVLLAAARSALDHTAYWR